MLGVVGPVLGSCVEVPNQEPTWFTDEAIGRLTVTSQHEERAFRTNNKARPYEQRVRPWNFLNLAHPVHAERQRLGIRCLVAPYEQNPEKRRRNTWHDRSSQDRSWTGIRTGGLEVDDDTVIVQSYRDYFDDHRRHTDAKMLGSDGERCHPWTRGLLQPAVIAPTRLIHVGKESNPLTDDNQTDDSIAFEYAERVCRCGQQVDGRRKWCSEACRARARRARKPTRS